MRLKDKIFQMRNDQPYLVPIGIHLPEFAKLWEADKTEEKTDFAKQVAYIYHMHEYDSPYYDRRNKQAEIIKDVFGKKWKPTKRVQAALSKYRSLDESAERRTMDAATAACDLIANNIQKLAGESEQFEEIIAALDLDIKMADNASKKVEAFKKKLDIQEQQMKILTNITKTMPQLEKTIETLLSLRKKVTTSVFKGEGADTMIGEFLMDNLMDELHYEEVKRDLEDISDSFEE